MHLQPVLTDSSIYGQSEYSFPFHLFERNRFIETKIIS